jgi:hypothetical protein
LGSFISIEEWGLNPKLSITPGIENEHTIVFNKRLPPDWPDIFLTLD